MKKLLVMLLATASVSGWAQRYTASFEDGVKVDYEIISDKFEKCKPVNILFGGFICNSAEASGKGLGISYYQPDKFFASARVGFLAGFGYFVEGTYFIQSWDKIKKTSFSVKSEYVGNNTVKKYVIKYDIPKQKHWGPHIGYESINPFYTEDVKGGGMLTIGLGYLQGRFLNVMIAGDKKPVKMRGTGHMGAYADVAIYMVSYSDLYTGTKYSNVGFRTYITGKASVWGSRDWGVTYALGVGTGGVSSVYPVAGLGLYAGI